MKFNNMKTKSETRNIVLTILLIAPLFVSGIASNQFAFAGGIMTDDDMDGYYFEVDDCDDTDPNVNPDAEEVLGDGVDQNCDGADNPTTFENISGNFTKMIKVDCVDGLDIANDTASSCNLWITYNGTESGIMVDTIPAHLNVIDVTSTNSEECLVEFSNANGKEKSNKNPRVTSATIVTCELDEDDEVHIETLTRASPSNGKGNNQNKLDKYSPTGCGLFEVNGGILFYEGEGPITSESIPDDTMDPISVYTTPDDLDCDEILNDNDKCPFTPEDFDGVLDEDGCPDTELPFVVGWDVLEGEALDLQNSYVSYSKVPSNGLDVTFHFEGADNNRSYQVGIHNFPPDLSSCHDDFGGVSELADCVGPLTRQGIEVPAIEAFEFGTVLTNGTGYGEQGFWLTNIDPDTYNIEFHVRAGTCFGTDCSVIFQSPGPFNGTETIQIP
jgi:hypothetical protein